MSTQNHIPDVVLRASVSSRCNFNCTYCPKDDWKAGGMENYTPDPYATSSLTPEQYASALRHIRDGLGVQKISFTGGEPTLNPNLAELVRQARSLFQRVEMTTNGSRVTDSLAATLHLAGTDLVKVSIDSMDRQEFQSVVGLPQNPRVFDKVLASVRTLQDARLAIALNTVVMKRNLGQLPRLIDFAKASGASLHLLDYVFYPSKREDWEDQFVPMEYVAEVFADLYGTAEQVVRYGCTFYRFRAGATTVRFKDSMAATIRSAVCATCNEYCQEGPYGVKLSTHGWVTACPSIDPNKGVLLKPEDSTEEATSKLRSLLPMFRDTFPDTESFQTFLAVRGLRPRVTRRDVQQLLKAMSTNSRSNSDER